MPKTIIINADDFGLTDGICYGILDAYKKRGISSTSLIVNGEGLQTALAIIRDYSLKMVDIHLNLTYGSPLSRVEDVPSLCEANGCFHSSHFYHEGVLVNEEELIREFDAQIAFFIKHVGYTPTHIDIHHKYDFLNAYPKLRHHLIETYHIPMRMEAYSDDYPYWHNQKVELMMDPSFDLEHARDYMEKAFLNDHIELPTHVGFVDEKIMEISSLNTGRMKDHATVISSVFKNAYKDLGYQLVGWEDIIRT